MHAGRGEGHDTHMHQDLNLTRVPQTVLRCRKGNHHEWTRGAGNGDTGEMHMQDRWLDIHRDSRVEVLSVGIAGGSDTTDGNAPSPRSKGTDRQDRQGRTRKGDRGMRGPEMPLNHQGDRVSQHTRKNWCREILSQRLGQGHLVTIAQTPGRSGDSPRNYSLGHTGKVTRKRQQILSGKMRVQEMWNRIVRRICPGATRKAQAHLAWQAIKSGKRGRAPENHGLSPG